MKILTIIVTYNGMQWIDHCVSSVVGSTINSDIFIVDNGSTDGTQDYIRSHFPNVVFQQSPNNLGFGKANNIGLRFAIEKKYEYAYLLNQDAWIEPNTLEKLIEQHKLHPEYGILSPMQMKPDLMHFEYWFDRLVSKSIYSEFCQDLYFNRLKDIYNVEFVQAAHWLLSIECIKKTGLFSPIFPHYGEDDNYCHRTLYHGFKIGVLSSAYGVHDAKLPDASKPREKNKYMKYIEYLVYVSNIYSSQKHRVRALFFSALHDARVNKSLFQFKVLMKVILKLKSIKHCNDIAKEQGAFIQ